MTDNIRILTPKNTYTVDYPEAIAFAESQAGIFWLPGEADVEKDYHELKTEMSEAEVHGIVTTLKLFTLYELKVGNDYWRDFVAKVFPRPDIQRMAATFSFMELGVHAPFYNRINEVLGLDSDEFYNSYLDDPILKDRMEWIGRRAQIGESHFEKLRSIGVFSLIEGGILYSAFAYLKHFQNQGKNKLVNINAGINFSAQDEDIHSSAGAWLFNTYLKELRDSGYTDINTLIKDLYRILEIIAEAIYEHESHINSKIFERGEIDGITLTQLNTFTKSRLNLCLSRLNINPIFKIENDIISSWFYNNLNSSILHDFFYRQGSDYNRNWDERKFIW